MGRLDIKARKLRSIIETMAQGADDDIALNAVDLFPQWSGDGVAYTVGYRVRYGTTLYKVLQAHTSQSDWTPDAAVSLFARVDDLAEEFPEWVQPTGATDAYAKGAKVSYDGKHYESTIDNNVWAPTVYGWSEVTT